MSARNIIISIFFLFMFVSSAFAADWGQVMTPDRPLNIRTARSLNSKRVTTIMPGDQVVVDFEKGEWVAVFSLPVGKRNESLALGYVKVKYLVAVNVAIQTWGKLMTPKGMLNVRAKRSRSSEHVVTLQAGQVVKVDFQKDGWFAVFQQGETVRDEKRALGYARDKYLFAAPVQAAKSIEPEAEPASEPEVRVKVEPVEVEPSAYVLVKPEPEPQVQDVASGPVWGKVVTLTRRINVRSKRTANSSLVTTLKSGDTVRVDFLVRGWLAVFDMDQTTRDESKARGYIYASLLGEPVAGLKAHSLQSSDAPQPSSAVAMESSAPEIESLQDGSERITFVPKDQGDEPRKGPIPRADKVRHGFKYAIMDRSASSSASLGRILVKVYLDVTVIPKDESLKDFTKTIFKEEMGDAKELMILVYLPGQDLKDLAYCQAKFKPLGLEEFWTRRSTLHGTHLAR